jgi:hypothetical protein
MLLCDSAQKFRNSVPHSSDGMIQSVKRKVRKLYKVMKLNNIKYCETKLTQDSSLNYLNWQEMIRLFVTRKHLFYTAKYKTFLVPLNIYHLINRVMNIVLKLRKIVGHCCS